MRVLNFLQSLLPSFSKDTLIEDLRLTRNEIKEHTLPSYNTALSLLRTWKFKSPALEKQLGMFNRIVKGGNPIVTIHDAFPTIIKNLDNIEELVSKTFNQEIAAKGLTYVKANALQFCEAVSFVSKFSRKWLNYIYICETAQYPDGDASVTESLTAAEIEWLDANFLSFCTAFNVVSGNPAHVDKKLADIPDIEITEDNAQTLAATVGSSKIDPFQMSMIPTWMNPVYHVGMFVAEWQADRYKAAKEEVKLIQLRKLNMEKLTAGKPDAHVQKEIKYMENRIQGINFKIAEMEKDNGIK